MAAFFSLHHRKRDLLDMVSLETLGWNSFFEKEATSFSEAGFEPGRVAVENRHSYLIYTRYGDYPAEASGRLLFTSESSAELPKVGDWVVVSLFEPEGKAVIHQVLTRKSKFSRKVAGKKTEEQIVATNVDTIFIVQSLDRDFNLKRLERYLVMVFESGANPIIILNKADLCEDFQARVAEVKKIAPEVSVIAMSAKTEHGLEYLRSYIREGLTFCFVGSSGVGKSTLINRIIGKEVQRTNDVRESDAKGQHTTTRRELIVLPQGGLLIDTPGIRELHLWNADAGLNETFANIESLAAQCHFRDCTHTKEKRCAVRDGVERGEISAEHYANYLKLQKELDHLEETRDQNRYLEKKKKTKEAQRSFNKVKGRKT